MRRFRSIRWLLVLSLACCLPAAARGEDDLEARAKQLGEPLIRSGTAQGLAVGLVIAKPGTEPRTIVFGLGHSDEAGQEPCTGQTLFEIGSVTKTFTGLLLADMTLRGEVALDDPVQKYLPADVKMPIKGDQLIRLRDLSDHSSGLPRLPTNMKPKDAEDPYADYDPARLYEFLNAYKLRHAPGDRSAYSNLGVGLLGHLLELRADKPYEALLRERVLAPLGMNDTVIALDDEHRAALAQGHDSDGKPVKPWELNVFAGAGALRSNVDDMLKYVIAQFCLADSPLNEAIRLSHQTREPLEANGHGVALGWHLNLGGDMIWHNGGTGGYHSYVGFRPKDHTGVVVLCNTSTSAVDELGVALLDLISGRKVRPPQIQETVALSPEQLEPLVGKYVMGDGAEFTITRDGDQLFAQLTLQDKYRIWPTSETEFFYRIVDAQITFERDEQGKVTGLVLHQGGRDMKAPRKKADG